MQPTSETTVRRLRWLLLIPPCLPGVLMLVSGWWLDVAAPGSRVMPGFVAPRAHVLYVAGTVALAGGLAMSMFVAWKIVRPSPLDDDEDDEEDPAR